MEINFINMGSRRARREPKRKTKKCKITGRKLYCIYKEVPTTVLDNGEVKEEYLDVYWEWEYKTLDNPCIRFTDAGCMVESHLDRNDIERVYYEGGTHHCLSCNKKTYISPPRPCLWDYLDDEWMREEEEDNWEKYTMNAYAYIYSKKELNNLKDIDWYTANCGCVYEVEAEGDLDMCMKEVCKAHQELISEDKQWFFIPWKIIGARNKEKEEISNSLRGKPETLMLTGDMVEWGPWEWGVKDYCKDIGVNAQCLELIEKALKYRIKSGANFRDVAPEIIFKHASKQKISVDINLLETIFETKEHRKTSVLRD